jgi:hypothetical protein
MPFGSDQTICPRRRLSAVILKCPSSRFMTWQEICEDPRFENLPYKVETDRLGRIIMSHARNRRGPWQDKLTRVF